MIKLVWQEAERTYLLTFDAVTSEQYDLETQVTEHPIEKGSPLVDHVRPLPVRITLEGLVTDTPVFLPEDHTDGMVSSNFQVETPRQTLADQVQRHGGVAGVGFGTPIEAQIAASAARNITFPGKRGAVRTNVGNRKRLIVATLLRLRAQASQLTVETPLRRWENMVLANASVTRAPKAQMKVQLTLQEVQGAVVTALQVVPKVSTGRTNKPRTEPDPEQTAAPQSSFLYRQLFQ